MCTAQWIAVITVLCGCSLQSLFAAGNSGFSAGVYQITPVGSYKESKAKKYPKQGGNFSIGVRNTINVFTNSPKSFGSGAGGSFRLQLTDRVNTEFFADYISNNLFNKAKRIDAHIGWHVIYYLIDTKGFTRKLTPYLAAGHCFDYTGIRLNGEQQTMHKRWTSAVQLSLGCHYNITPKFDITLS